MLKASTDSASYPRTDVKMSFTTCASAGPGGGGPAGKWSWHTGGEEVAVYLCVQVPEAFESTPTP